jgi:hypothetical protein
VTPVASSAALVGIHGDPGTELEIHAGTHLHHLASELMTQDHRAIGAVLPGIEVDVRATHTTGVNPHKQFLVAWYRLGNFLYLKLAWGL